MEHSVLFQAQRKALEVEFCLKRIVKGQERPIRVCLLSLYAGGHILLEGLPGVAKTLLFRTLGKLVSAPFERIQGQPDLLPGDVLGRHMPDFKGGMNWCPGPLLKDPNLAILLLDEINRTPTKTQSVFLEAMGERRVTVEGKVHLLHPLFMVVATRNPLERGETWELPEAQRDRFLFETSVEYPPLEDEISIAFDSSYLNLEEKLAAVTAVITPDEILAARALVLDHVKIDLKLRNYIARLVDATRHPDRYGIKNISWKNRDKEEQVSLESIISAGSSPRGTRDLGLAARFHAWFEGRDYATPHDVSKIVSDVLLHRIFFAPGHHYRRSRAAEAFLKAIIQAVDHA